MRGAGLTILACAAALTAGCVTQRTTSDGRPPAPDPTPAPAVPVSAVVNTMTVIAAPPVDTNGNLFRDRIDVEVYLFAQPHPSPVLCDGQFTFVLYPMGQAGSPGQRGTVLRTWTIPAAAARGAEAMSLMGPCYRFSLSLLANGGSDRLGADSVDLVGAFEVPGAPVVNTQNVTTLQLGAIPGTSARPGRQ